MGFDVALLYFMNSFAGISHGGDALIIGLAEYVPFLMVAVLILALLRSPYSHFQRVHIFVVTILAGVLTRVVVVEGIRYFLHRPRPPVLPDIVPLLVLHSWSFPSGHAAFLFGCGAALYAYNRVFGVLFLCAALIVSLARVAAGVHYPSDILGGAVSGVFVAYLLVKALRKFEQPNRK